MEPDLHGPQPDEAGEGAGVNAGRLMNLNAWASMNQAMRKTALLVTQTGS